MVNVKSPQTGALCWCWGLFREAVAPELLKVIKGTFIGGKQVHHNASQIGTNPFAPRAFLAHEVGFVVFGQRIGHRSNVAGAGAGYDHHIIGKAAVFGDIKHDNLLAFIIFQGIEHGLKQGLTAGGWGSGLRVRGHGFGARAR